MNAKQGRGHITPLLALLVTVHLFFKSMTLSLSRGPRRIVTTTASPTHLPLLHHQKQQEQEQEQLSVLRFDNPITSAFIRGSSFKLSLEKEAQKRNTVEK